MEFNIKIIIVIVFATMMLMTACQQTPEEEVVIQKDNAEKLVILSANENEEAKKLEKEIIFEYETPEHVTEQFAIIENALNVSIDANVTMPEIDSVPVAKIKSSPFTQERADKLREYFMQGGKLVTQYVRTKEDYDALIIEAQRGHESDGEFVFDESDEQWIKELLEMREQAPEEGSENLISDYSIGSENELRGRIIVNGEDIGRLYASAERFRYNRGSATRVDNGKSYDEYGNLIEYPTIEINMTVNEAIQKAQSILEELGISGMAVKEIKKAYFYGSEEDYLIREKPMKGGYKILLMREFGGMMPIYITSASIDSKDQYETSPPMDAECLEITIDDESNIQSFEWRDPIEVIEILTEHVDILSFESIMERMRLFAKVQWEYYDENSAEIMRTIKIHSIGLNLIYLPIKNNANEFMYAPCWAFAYKNVREYTCEDEEWMKSIGMFIHEDQTADRYLLFSAIDGASVSPYSMAIANEAQANGENFEADNEN